MKRLLATMVLLWSTTVTAAGEQWLVKEERSPLDDSRTVHVLTEALRPTVGPLGLPVTPTLRLRCQENETNLFVDWSTFIDNESTTVTYRVDKLPAEKDEWRVSTNFQAVGLWKGNEAIPFISGLFGHATLVLQITPYGENTQTTLFNIQGIEAAVAPLAEACNWREFVERAKVTHTIERNMPGKRPTFRGDEFENLLRSVEEMDRRVQDELGKANSAKP